MNPAVRHCCHVLYGNSYTEYPHRVDVPATSPTGSLRRCRLACCRVGIRAGRPRGLLVCGLVALVVGAALISARDRPAAAVGRAPTRNAGCDPIDPSACLLPFPNDFYTVRDPTTDTGRRVHLVPESMPRNFQNLPIDPAGWNHNDGFSPGSDILTHVPGIDLVRTGTAPITNIGRSLVTNAPIVLLNTRTGRRHPYWAELDATTTDESRRALIIRPARNFDDATRYIVALRGMRDSNGRLIGPSPAFAAFLNGHGDAARQRHMNTIFDTLDRAGVRTSDLYLAWDFTVASERNSSERLLHIRDDAFASLNGTAPHFTIASIIEFTEAQNPRIARRIEGTFAVPSYLDLPGGPPGSGFNNAGGRELPTRLPGNTQVAPFLCEVPRAAFTQPAHAAIYGHGLFSDRTEVDDDNVQRMANDHDFLFCGTEWLGLNDDNAERANDAKVFTDFSRFPAFADRLQQSILSTLFLGRLMVHPGGFASNPAFRAGDSPVIDLARGLVYDGNSLGGDMGGALTAVAQDFTRAVLGVPGMNFSTMLTRSRDFPIGLVQAAYPNPLDQQLAYSLIQMLWDRAEADGYAHHMTTDPLPGTPAHRVLMHVAFGDQQVANVASDVEARTIGASLRTPAIAPGRSLDVVPYWGIARFTRSPFAGSAMVVFDSGSSPPPPQNVPPTEGVDPHQDPRSSEIARQQKAIFLDTGDVVDVCGHRPCVIPHAP